LNVVGYNHNKSIDVVDDEEDIVTIFKVLQENGYHVMGFTNPLFILIIFVNFPINLV
jgi:hypothetical protein